MSFPLIKLGYLAIRQISKPLANGIKNKAKTNEFVRNKILLPPAQLYHNVDAYLQKKSLKVNITAKTKPLSVDEAINLSAEILETIVIFSIGSAIVLFEYARQIRKDSIKEGVLNERLFSFQSRMNEALENLEKHSQLLEVWEKMPAQPAEKASTTQNVKQGKVELKNKSNEIKVKSKFNEIKVPTAVKDINSKIVLQVVKEG